MNQRNKLFPLKLPQKFHGEIKPYRPPSQLYLEKSSKKDSTENYHTKISNWKRKILDRDVVSQRRQFLVHPAKISQDNPDWLKSTYHHFHRTTAISLKKESNQQRKKYDVFGQKRIDPQAYQTQTDFAGRIKPEVTSKVGSNSEYFKINLQQYRNKSEVADKIGAVQVRPNFVKRPQLKVGSSNQQNFVDTYSVN